MQLVLCNPQQEIGNLISADGIQNTNFKSNSWVNLGCFHIQQLLQTRLMVFYMYFLLQLHFTDVIVNCWYSASIQYKST